MCWLAYALSIKAFENCPMNKNHDFIQKKLFEKLWLLAPFTNNNILLMENDLN